MLSKPIEEETVSPSPGTLRPVLVVIKITPLPPRDPYNAAAAGPFNKAITVKLAGIDAPLEIRITGEVLTSEDYAKFEKEKSSKTTKSGGN